MLNRQKTLLRVIEKADRPLSSTVLFKLAFLLRQETSFAEDGTFYDFLPYKYGPYSFAMHRELEALTAYGYLKTERIGSGISFRVGPTIHQFSLQRGAELAVEAILSQYLKTGQRDLLRDVYARYPWYAVNTELSELVDSPAPACKHVESAVYTIGYHRTSVDGFANRLLQKGIRNLLDVRANPVSRKYGFARSSLGLICRKLGLGYHHFPALGIPSSDRRGVQDKNGFEQLFQYYEREILRNNKQDVAAVSTLVSATPSVLLCAEENAEDCHRSRLAVAVADSTGLPIFNL